ncbi:MAG: hypothetical protein HY289_11465 [Planctomycetes bacterium]|nr:hypothetical protein [Planctomycetota bacterium]
MFIRVAEPGRPSFQLRKNEEGLSVFDSDAVDPPLSGDEILDAFRADSLLVSRSRQGVEAKGLTIVKIEGSAVLPARLREAHAEIRRGLNMTRAQFKKALQELE